MSRCAKVAISSFLRFNYHLYHVIRNLTEIHVLDANASTYKMESFCSISDSERVNFAETKSLKRLEFIPIFFYNYRFVLIYNIQSAELIMATLLGICSVLLVILNITNGRK